MSRARILVKSLRYHFSKAATEAERKPQIVINYEDIEENTHTIIVDNIICKCESFGVINQHGHPSFSVGVATLSEIVLVHGVAVITPAHYVD